MTGRSLSQLLVGTGAVVAIAAGVAMTTGWEPRLSPFMLKLVFYKLAFIGAAGLIAVGAIIGRRYGSSHGVENSPTDNLLNEPLPPEHHSTRPSVRDRVDN
jgi:multisubunit Na+/H+ antiporter MnhB subunit